MITLWGKIENGDITIINNQEKKDWLSKNKNYKGNLLCKISKTTKERTQDQNRALHLWLTMKAKQCKDAGITTQMALSKTIDLDMTPEMMKEFWRVIQNAMFRNGKSTKNLEKVGQIEEIAEHLNRFFAEKFNLEGIEFPNDPNKIRDY